MKKKRILSLLLALLLCFTLCGCGPKLEGSSSRRKHRGIRAVCFVRSRILEVVQW